MLSSRPPPRFAGAIEFGVDNAELDANMVLHPTVAEELVMMHTLTETHVRMAVEYPR